MMTDQERARLDLVEYIARLAKARNGSGAPSSSGASLVFRPGGITAGNVFATWGALYAVLIAFQGPVTIQIDDSIVSPAHIPVAGMPVASYALGTSVTFDSVANETTVTGGADLRIDNGVKFALPAQGMNLTFKGSILASFLGAAALITNSGATQETNIFVEEASRLRAGGAGPVLSVTAGFGEITATDGSELGDGARNVLLNAAPGISLVQTFGGSIANAAAVAGAGAQLVWDSAPPGAQGAGVLVQQVGGQFSAKIRGTFDGTAAVPYHYDVTAVDMTGGDHALTPAEYAHPLIQLFTTAPVGGDRLVTLPQVQGAVYDVDLSGYVFNGHKITFTAGGVTRDVTAANLAATGATGCRVAVVNNSFDITRLS